MVSDYSRSEIENWNNAERFSKGKIMDILQELDKLELESEFGYSNEGGNIDKDVNEKEISYRKIKAFKFFIARIIQLMRNAEFSIKKDKENFNSYFKKLIFINSKIIEKLYIKISDGEVILNKNYNVVLECAKEIKSKINKPLNENNLIFRKSEEFDIDELIKRDEENFINKS